MASKLRAAVISELLAEAEEVAQHLVSQAVEHCKERAADFICCGAIANRGYVRVFRKNGFVQIPFIKGGDLYAYSTSPRLPPALLEDHRGWLMQIGDSDRI